MKKLYLSVDDIDIWVATISEKTLPGATVGPTGACIMGKYLILTDIWVATILKKTLPGAVVGTTGACIMGKYLILTSGWLPS